MDYKTNVMRLLDKQKIPYNHYCYADTDALSGEETGAFPYILCGI